MSSNEVTMVQQYEEIDGELVHPLLAGQIVPCPPEWVRDLSKPLDNYKFCCLAKDVQHIYPPSLVDPVVEYLKNWPKHRTLGTGLLIIGRDEKKLDMLASGLINEIFLRYRAKSDITSARILTRRSIPWFARNWAKHNDVSMSYYNDVHDSTVLWISEPLAVQGLDSGRWLIDSVYEHRNGSRKPTITTITAKRDLHLIGKVAEEILGYRTTQIIANNNIVVKEQIEDVE